MSNPFFGTIISIIQQNETRLEGILTSTNRSTSTITLSDVVLFGTEDRIVSKFIPYIDQKFPSMTIESNQVKSVTQRTIRSQAPSLILNVNSRTSPDDNEQNTKNITHPNNRPKNNYTNNQRNKSVNKSGSNRSNYTKNVLTVQNIPLKGNHRHRANDINDDYITYGGYDGHLYT